MKGKFVIPLVVGVVLGTASLVWCESPSVLLEKGIYTEQTVGDLTKAIEIYQKIIADARAARPAIARAYLRLGECLAKQGKREESIAAFEELIARFPEQKGLVARARKHVPTVRFPEIVGCRVKETLRLFVRPESAKAGPGVPKTIWQLSHLQIAWSVDPRLAKGVRSFSVSVRPEKVAADAVRDHVWRVSGIGADVRSEVYGKSSAKVAVHAKPLKPGRYVVTVGAHDASRAIGSATALLTVKPLQYAQITIEDVQPDGTKTGRCIIQNVNRLGRALKTTGFVNSDFVKVKRMYDDKGRPLKFTTKHEGSHYRYKLALNEAVPAGEHLVYASEGSVLGLVKPVRGAEDEFEYRMVHYPGSDVPTRRLEVYRLPKGAELLETTPADMGRRVRDGRIELFQEKVVPPKGSITTVFRYRLKGGELASTQGPKLNPAPWADGELLRLSVNTSAGGEMGTLIYTTDAVTSAGKEAWRVQSYMVIPMAKTEQYRCVDAERASFRPITGRTKTQQGDYQATYAPGEVQWQGTSAGKTSSKQVKLEGVAYDNEQALFLIRRMPLAEDYRGSFMIFAVQNPVVLECRIEVTGREKITVPVGTFDCYVVELAIYSGNISALKHTLWFSADKHQYLVKYDAGSATMTLAEARVRQKGKPVQFCDEERGLSLSAPAGWHLYKPANPGRYKFKLHLLPPELKAWCQLAADEAGTLVTSARKVAEGEIKGLEGALKGYTVRANSWSEQKRSGMPTATYVADYQDEGKDMVEYRTYLLGKSMVYWFVFRIEKDQFEQSKAAFDSIVASLKTG